MAFPAGQSLEDIGRDSEPSKGSSAKLEGPPPGPRPRPARSGGSLYSTAGQAAMEAGQAGLGGEGGDPSLIGLQGLSLIQRGVQMVNLAFPDNPGLVAVLGDVIGRLQGIVPQLVNAAANQSQGMGLMSQMTQGMSPMGMGQGGPMAGMPGMGAGQMPPPPPADPMAPMAPPTGQQPPLV
jgi:hypothetical protein